MIFKIFCGNKKIFLILSVLFLNLLSVSTALAAANSDYVPLVNIPGVNAAGGALSYLSGLYNFLISVVGIFAMAVIIYGGLRYLTSAGNPGAVGDAKDAITSAIIGLLLALASWVILNTINPDILVLKNPGVGGAGGLYSYGALANSCTSSPGGEGTSTSPCHCIDNPPKDITGTVPSPTPIPSPAPSVTPTPGPSGTVCNQICSSSTYASDGQYHCVKADLRVGSTAHPIDKNITVRVGDRVYFDARSYSVDYGYANLNLNADPYDKNSGFSNGIDRYEICYSGSCTVIGDYGCNEPSSSCSWFLGTLGFIGLNTFWDVCGITDTASGDLVPLYPYTSAGKYEVTLWVTGKNGCYRYSDKAYVNVVAP